MERLLVIEMRKTQVLMNKPVYLDLSILDLSKTVIITVLLKSNIDKPIV